MAASGERVTDIAFPKALQQSVQALIVLLGDTDTNLRVRAEEALTVVVKANMNQNHDVLVMCFFECLRTPTLSTRVLCSAATHFGRLCSRISLCRRSQLVVDKNGLVTTLIRLWSLPDNVQLQEAISAQFEAVSKTFGPFMSEQDVTQLINIFLSSITSPIESCRRASALCVSRLAAVVHHSAAAFLCASLAGTMVDALAALDQPKTADDIHYNTIQGVCLVWSSLTVSLDEDVPRIHKVVLGALPGLASQLHKCAIVHGGDARIAVACLELTCVLLGQPSTAISFSPSYYHECIGVLLDLALGASPVRVTVRALAITCLSRALSRNPRAVVLEGLRSQESQHKLNKLLNFNLFDDPQLRANSVELVVSVVRAVAGWPGDCSDWHWLTLVLASPHEPTRSSLMDSLWTHLQKAISDSSSIVRRVFCVGARSVICDAIAVAEDDLATSIAHQLLALTTDAYWLVCIEALRGLQAVYLSLVCRASQGPSLHQQAIDAALSLCTSDDHRIRTAAAECISVVCVTAPNAPALLILTQDTKDAFLYVCRHLTQLINTGHSLQGVSGGLQCYELLVRAAVVSPELCSLAHSCMGEVLAATVERVTATSLCGDVLAHTSALVMLASLVPSQLFAPYVARVMSHAGLCIALVGCVVGDKLPASLPPESSDDDDSVPDPAAPLSLADLALATSRGVYGSLLDALSALRKSGICSWGDPDPNLPFARFLEASLGLCDALLVHWSHHPDTTKMLEEVLDLVLDVAWEAPSSAVRCISKLVLHVTCLAPPELRHSHCSNYTENPSALSSSSHSKHKNVSQLRERVELCCRDLLAPFLAGQSDLTWDVPLLHLVCVCCHQSPAHALLLRPSHDLFQALAVETQSVGAYLAVGDTAFVTVLVQAFALLATYTIDDLHTYTTKLIGVLQPCLRHFKAYPNSSCRCMVVVCEWLFQVIDHSPNAALSAGPPTMSSGPVPSSPMSPLTSPTSVSPLTSLGMSMSPSSNMLPPTAPPHSPVPSLSGSLTLDSTFSSAMPPREIARKVLLTCATAIAKLMPIHEAVHSLELVLQRASLCANPSLVVDISHTVAISANLLFAHLAGLTDAYGSGLTTIPHVIVLADILPTMKPADLESMMSLLGLVSPLCAGFGVLQRTLMRIVAGRGSIAGLAGLAVLHLAQALRRCKTTHGYEGLGMAECASEVEMVCCGVSSAALLVTCAQASPPPLPTTLLPHVIASTMTSLCSLTTLVCAHPLVDSQVLLKQYDVINCMETIAQAAANPGLTVLQRAACLDALFAMPPQWAATHTCLLLQSPHLLSSRTLQSVLWLAYARALTRQTAKWGWQHSLSVWFWSTCLSCFLLDSCIEGVLKAQPLAVEDLLEFVENDVKTKRPILTRRLAVLQLLSLCTPSPHRSSVCALFVHDIQPRVQAQARHLLHLSQAQASPPVSVTRQQTAVAVPSPQLLSPLATRGAPAPSVASEVLTHIASLPLHTIVDKYACGLDTPLFLDLLKQHSTVLADRRAAQVAAEELGCPCERCSSTKVNMDVHSLVHRWVPDITVPDVALLVSHPILDLHLWLSIHRALYPTFSETDASPASSQSSTSSDNESLVFPLHAWLASAIEPLLLPSSPPPRSALLVALRCVDHLFRAHKLFVWSDHNPPATTAVQRASLQLCVQCLSLLLDGPSPLVWSDLLPVLEAVRSLVAYSDDTQPVDLDKESNKHSHFDPETDDKNTPAVCVFASSVIWSALLTPLARVLDAMYCLGLAPLSSSPHHLGHVMMQQLFFEASLRHIDGVSDGSRVLVTHILASLWARFRDYGYGCLFSLPYSSLRAAATDQDSRWPNHVIEGPFSKILRVLGEVGWEDQIQYQGVWELLYFALVHDHQVMLRSQPDTVELDDINELSALQTGRIACLTLLLHHTQLAAPGRPREGARFRCRNEKPVFLQSARGHTLKQLRQHVAASMVMLVPHARVSWEEVRRAMVQDNAFTANIERVMHYVRFDALQLPVPLLFAACDPISTTSPHASPGLAASSFHSKKIFLFVSQLVDILKCAQSPLQLQAAALGSITILSDMLDSTAAYDVLQVLRHVISQNLTADFVVQQYAVLCACKITSLLPSLEPQTQSAQSDMANQGPESDRASDSSSRTGNTTSGGANSSAGDTEWLCDYIKECVGCAELAVLNAVFCGVLYLAEARHAVITTLFDCIVTRALDLMRSCEDLQLVKRCIAAVLFVIEQMPRLAEERGASRLALEACMHMCLTTESREICCCIVMGLERLVVSFALSHTMRQSLHTFAQSLASNGLCSDRARRLLSLALCCACLYTGDGDRMVDMPPLHHTEDSDQARTCGVAYAAWLLETAGSPLMDHSERQCCLHIIPHLLADFQPRPETYPALVTRLFVGGSCVTNVSLVVRELLELLPRDQQSQVIASLWREPSLLPCQRLAVLASVTGCAKLSALLVHASPDIVALALPLITPPQPNL